MKFTSFILFLIFLLNSCGTSKQDQMDEEDIQKGYEEKAEDYRNVVLTNCKNTILIKADSLAKIMIEEDLLHSAYLDSLPNFPEKPIVEYQKEKTKEFNPKKIKE